MSNHQFSNTKIKTGKVFQQGNKWVVSHPATDGRSVYLAYDSQEAAQAAMNAFTTPITKEDRRQAAKRRDWITAHNAKRLEDAETTLRPIDQPKPIEPDEPSEPPMI